MRSPALTSKGIFFRRLSAWPVPAAMDLPWLRLFLGAVGEDDPADSLFAVFLQGAETMIAVRAMV